MTTALTIPQHELPTTLGGAGKAGVNVPPKRVGLRVPLLKMVHKADSKEAIDRGELPGTFRYGDRVLGDQVTVVFLKVDDVRHYDVTVDANKPPRTLCASHDGQVPVPEIEEPQAPECFGCEHAQWRNGVDPKSGKTKRVPPPCKSGFAFLGVLPDLDFAPFWFLCQGTAEKPAANFVRGFLSDPTTKALSQWKVSLTAERQQAQTGGLSWYTPVFAVRETLAVDAFASFVEAAKDVPFTFFLSQGDAERNDGSGASDEDVPF